MPELVRYPLTAAEDELDQISSATRLTPRERRLYVALTIVLSLNLSILCGALTFFGLLYGP
jgi:hypothetical protein